MFAPPGIFLAFKLLLIASSYSAFKPQKMSINICICVTLQHLTSLSQTGRRILLTLVVNHWSTV